MLDRCTRDFKAGCLGTKSIASAISNLGCCILGCVRLSSSIKEKYSSINTVSSSDLNMPLSRKLQNRFLKQYAACSIVSTNKVSRSKAPNPLTISEVNLVSPAATPKRCATYPRACRLNSSRLLAIISSGLSSLFFPLSALSQTFAYHEHRVGVLVWIGTQNRQLEGVLNLGWSFGVCRDIQPETAYYWDGCTSGQVFVNTGRVFCGHGIPDHVGSSY